MNIISKKHASIVLLIISRSTHIVGHSEMKKCHLCGKTQETSAKKFREVDEECYCIFCLDQDGNPRKPNPVRKSIMSFWRDRDAHVSESKIHSS